VNHTYLAGSLTTPVVKKKRKAIQNNGRKKNTLYEFFLSLGIFYEFYL